MKIISVVGARPNFMKIAPFIKEIKKYNIEHLLVHTGQHYDDEMSLYFFQDLNIPAADINLGIGSGSHAEQVGNTMVAFEKVLIEQKPDWVVVMGDVNATLACSITAKKMHVKVCHIEAGLRSRDDKMPEEINRLVTDRISDLLLTPDFFSTENLIKEGVDKSKIHHVGNIMIDTLESNVDKAKNKNVSEIILKNSLRGQPNKVFKNFTEFGVITMHRPSNVDNFAVLSNIVDFFCNNKSLNFSLFWTIHPRTKIKLKEFNLWDSILRNNRIILLNPLRYHDMLKLNLDAKIFFTDSGGIQEECTVLKTPCITLRTNTERPITLIEHGGVSILVKNDIKIIENNLDLVLNQSVYSKRPKYWDGNVANRCLKAILEYN